MQNKKNLPRGGGGGGVYGYFLELHNLPLIFYLINISFFLQLAKVCFLFFFFLFFLHHSILLMGILTLQGILIKYGTSTVPNPIHSLST